MDVNVNYMVLDFETRSEVDLKSIGSDEYARHQSTEILCCAWSLGTRETLRAAPVHLWTPRQAPGDFLDVLTDPKTIKAAHNAGFEQAIVRRVLARTFFKKYPRLKVLPPSEWLCTASLAAALALPRSLSAAAHVLKLKEQKDDLGHKVMLKLSKPRRPSKENLDTYWGSDEDLASLYSYCKQDIVVTKELLLRLPPLTETERRIWILDQVINQRGFLVDRPLVQTVLHMAQSEMDHLARETYRITDGEVTSTGQLTKVLAWLETQKVFLPNLKAETVDVALAELGDHDAAELLRIRKDASRTSTKKYAAFEARSRGDGRLRENILYHGASTGRFSGMGLQCQNLPRSVIKNTDLAAEILGDADLETVRLIYGSPMETFSSCLRSMILPSKGKTFFVGDYASIEVRVLFWLARHDAGLEAFRRNADLYVEQAAEVYRKAPAEISKTERGLGKASILGMGYGMAAPKFQATCLTQYRIDINLDLAKQAVTAYRTKHRPVVQLWHNLERAAIAAVKAPGKVFEINRVSWFLKGRFLFCKLPSGRKIAYCDPVISYEPPRWGGEPRPVLYYHCVNSLTRQWGKESTYGGALVENCLASDTRVLSNRGWVPICEINLTDKIFDGVEWVAHDGVISQGTKEVGECLGVQLTANHLILVGSKWRGAIHLDANMVSAALKLGRDLVPWWLRHRVLAKTLLPCVNAIAGKNILRKLALWRAVKLIGVQVVRTRRGAKAVKQKKDFLQLYPTQNYLAFGPTAIPAWCPDVPTRITARTLTTAAAELLFMMRGWLTESGFCATQKNLKTGMPPDLNLIESTITPGIFQAIYDLLADQKTRAIGAIVGMLRTAELRTTLLNFGKNFVRNGKAKTLFATIYNAERRSNKLWTITKKQEAVFDLLNCGPRNRFVVLSSGGPLIVHNCSQAIARDLMAEAMLRVEEKGYAIVLTVHDELVAENDRAEESVKEFESLMEELPAWATGLPVQAEGWSGDRYGKR